MNGLFRQGVENLSLKRAALSEARKLIRGALPMLAQEPAASRKMWEKVLSALNEIDEDIGRLNYILRTGSTTEFREVAREHNIKRSLA